jgi:hypothetical protein
MAAVALDKGDLEPLARAMEEGERNLARPVDHAEGIQYTASSGPQL